MSHNSTPASSEDRRIKKTRSAIQKAFTSLFLEHGFDDVQVGQIAEKADVSRSTFYQHFNGKDDVLCLTMSPMLTLMAESIVSAEEPQLLSSLTAHFWTNRKLARAVFAGSAKASVTRMLADHIDDRLAAELGTSGSRRLIAVHLASAQLALLEEWLSGRYRCSPAALAKMLHASTYSAATAILTSEKDVLSV